MRKAIVLGAVVALFGPVGLAGAQELPPDVKEGPTCKHCGMDRAKFASTRMVVEFDDGSKLHACSLHCVAVDLALQIDKTPVAIKVADADRKALVDAESALWVLGGNKPGVMTKRAKWAFSDRDAARRFVRENGGAVVSFEDAMRAAYEDMYADTKMIRERRAARRAAKGAPVPAPQPAPPR